MPRAISQVASRNRRKKVLKAAKGSSQGRRNLIRSARNGVHKALQYAYRDRRNRKRDFRRLWIQRISAAAKMAGTSYSVFMGGLIKSGIEIDRKQLAHLAVSDMDSFNQLVDAVKQQEA